jgi:transposase
MNKTYRPYEPDQPFLLSPALTDRLPEDHLIYLIRDVVSDLHLTTIDSVYER